MENPLYFNEECVKDLPSYDENPALKQNKDVARDGVRVTLCLGVGILLLFHEVTSLHPPLFHRNDFSTCIISERQ